MSCSPGDLVLVRSGGRVPADGTVLGGPRRTRRVDDYRRVSTGARRRPGDRVVAGTVATDSALRVRVDAVGDDTALAGIRRLVARGPGVRGPARRRWPTGPPRCCSTSPPPPGVMTFVVWLVLGDPKQAVERTVTVLVIACPHALGLAIPLVIALSTALAAQAGILVKDRLALERMRTVDAVLFDKTGTLTKGQPAVVGRRRRRRF